MKKILGISLVAVLAVSPLMARAAGELNAAKTIAANETVSGDALTTESYVKGAYNAALGQVRTVNDAVTTLNGNDQTVGSVLNAVKTKAAEGSYNAETNYEAGTIGHAIKNTSATAINALDAEASQTAGADGLALSVTEVDGKITAISGSIAPNTYDAYGAAANAVEALDATVSQTAGSDGLALRVVEENGVITGVTGSIAANTYDAYGDAATAEQNAKNYVDGKITGLGAVATQGGVENTIDALEYTTELKSSTVTGTVTVPTSATVSVANTWGGSAADSSTVITLNNGTANLTNGTVSAASLTTTASQADYAAANPTPASQEG